MGQLRRKMKFLMEMKKKNFTFSNTNDLYAGTKFENSIASL